MNLTARLIFTSVLAVVCSPVSVAESKQEEGEKLIRRAEQLTNIRSVDAPAFRLKASFKGLGDEAPTAEGTYTEIWVSRGRWRRESISGNFHRTEVGGEKLRWSLDNTQEIPERMGQLGTLMHEGFIRQKPVKVAAIRDLNVQGAAARCIELKGRSVANETLCVDSQKGVLLLSKTQTTWMDKKSEYSCQYGEYEQFVGRMYPRHIRCVDDGHTGIEVRVYELSAEPSLDARLFAPPAGAEELANCQDTVQGPKPLQTFEPEYPRGERQPNSPEVLWVIVGGRQTTRSEGGSLDREVLRHSSTGGGQPMGF